ncbi:MAG: biopolymer transporter ExbD [Pirellulales bacterium]
MSIIRFNCPTCGKSLKAPEKLAGRPSKCTRCGTRLIVPAEGVVRGDDDSPATEHALLLMPNKFGHAEDLIDMTAMVDIVFFLLIFFLVTSIQSLESVITLPSPKSSAGSTSATTEPNDYLNDPTFIVVTIDEDDIVYVEDEEVYGDQNLRAKLRAKRKEDPDRIGMLVVGNPEATHGTLVSVLDAGADAGIKELLFSVDERDGESGG